MGILKKFLIFILVINILVFYSCEPGELQLKIDEIIFENGKNEFDQKTLYLRAKNPQNIPQKAKKRKDTLIIGMPSPNEIFNPVFAVAANDVDINDSMWAPILEIDGNGNIVDGIAYMPEIFEETNTYVFTLKENLKWQDGTPLTSYDIEFTFKVLMDKTYTGTFERDNFDIVGWENYRDGITPNIEGFKIIDDRKFSITFNSLNSKKNYYFERIKPLALHFYGVDYVQGQANQLEKYNKSPFGNGAYKFVEYIDGEEIRLVSNEHYYKGQPKIPNLIFRIVNENNQLSLLENGDIDMIRKNVLVVQENIEILDNMGFVEAAITDYLGYGYIAINHNETIMQDKNLRKALVYGLDRQTIVDVCFGEFGRVIDIPQNTNSWVYPDDENFTKYSYDPEKAKELLNESGWVVGSDGIREKDGQKLVLKFLASTPNEVNDILISIMLENYRRIGIEVVVEQMESKTLLQKQNDAKEGKYSYHLAFLFTPFANPDPDSSSRFSTNGPSNRIAYSNEKVDKLLEEALSEKNETKRKNLYGELYKELSDDLPYIFLFEKMNMDVYSSKVKGMENISLYRWFTKDLEKLYFE